MSLNIQVRESRPNSNLVPIDDEAASIAAQANISLAPIGGEGRGEGELVSAEARGSKIPSIQGERARQKTIISEIKSKCARFALDAHNSITQHPKITGQGLNDRAADTFDPLYVIARHAGPDWEKKLHTAALALSATSDSDHSGTSLLLDIIDVFFERGDEKMFTRDLVDRLRNGGFESQKHSLINEYQISKSLRHYGIKPTTMRIGQIVRNGYVATDFREALRRYVPAQDAKARIEGIRRRMALQDEARAEAQKQAALIEQAIAATPRGKSLNVEEIVAKVRELQKNSHNNTKTTESANRQANL